MAKIIEEEDASSDINSDNYNNNNDSYSFNYHYNNSKSQDIRIKNLSTMMLSDNIDTPPKKFHQRPRLKSMTTPNPNFFLEEKEEILKNLSKKQRKTSDYSEKDSLSFNSRESVI